MKTKLGIVAALLLLTGIVTVPAFAIESVFQVDVKDADASKTYQVCMSSEGYEALASECMDFKGSEFKNYYAEFYFEDVLIGDKFYTSVEDLSTNQFVYKHLENTKVNPQIIDISVSNMGPKQAQATEYDVETETVKPDEEPAAEETTTWTDPKTGLVYDDIPTQGYYCLDFDNDYICDVDFNNGKMVIYGESEAVQETATATEDEPAVGESGNNDNDNNDANPYCDKFEDIGDWPDSGCHDRRDYDDSGPYKGLYHCNDGTYKEDWKDCKDVSGYDYDDSNDDDESNDNNEEDTGGSNPEGEEDDQNCGGESCSDDEKEDSTTDEDSDGLQ